MYSRLLLLLSAVCVFAPSGAQAALDDSTSSSATRSTVLMSSSDATAMPAATFPPYSEDVEACEKVPHGHGPRPTTDTPMGFLEFPEFSNLARNASTPNNYSKVYEDKHASVASDSYLGYKQLQKYSTTDCAGRCDSTDGCEAFNIFFERTPTLNVGPACNNSESSTLVKCAFWGTQLEASDATNQGYDRWDFAVVVAGSNAYNKNGGTTTSGASSMLTPQAGVISIVIMASVPCMLFS